jgi:hypothetical protein
MAAHKAKLISPQKEEVRHTHRNNWEVMKPFVKFSFKALKVIGLTLIAIVKALPMLKHHENHNTEVKRR